MTNGQMTGISTPAEGLIAYDTTNHALNVRTASAWTALGAGGANGDTYCAAGQFAQVGTAYAPGTAFSNPTSTTKLTATTIAAQYYNGSNYVIGTFTWNGSTWSHTGTDVTTPSGANYMSITALDSTHVALAYMTFSSPNYTPKIQMYTWSGSAWSATGTLYSGSAFSTAMYWESTTALDSTHIVLSISGGPSNTTVYTWNGSTFTATGTPLSGYAFNGMVALSSSTIVAINSGNQLMTWSWNGSTFSQVGNSKGITGVQSYAAQPIALLSSSSIAIWDGSHYLTSNYAWDGTNWTLSGSKTFADYMVGILALDSSTVVAFDPGNGGSPARLVTFNDAAVCGAGGGGSFSATGAGSTTGAVQFNGGSGVFTGDAATFYWDNSSKRLGIGNAAPTQALDVTGTITSNQMLLKSVTGASAPVGLANLGVLNAGSATTISFAANNTAYTTAACGAFTLSGMQDGGAYTLVVKGSGVGPATFTHAGMTIHSTGTMACTTSTHTIFTFIRAGTDVYVNMNTGF